MRVDGDFWQGLCSSWVGARRQSAVSVAGGSEARECLQTYPERAGKPAFEAATHLDEAPLVILKGVVSAEMRKPRET